MSNEANSTTKKTEMNVFLFITVVLFPLLSILLVSGYGFSIWIYQLLFGPTGF
ncbi:periplasmic nitrate reductase, NapE protein [Catenovulum maritimum]|uniref:periplasmic nitrate reductase, NapE protein n=1 Tax=Catenovulum maritimum TaxID=1513271 RepID=UPI00097CAFC0|nr:periplasmic nitrate reductase, NapE protein [Catenovulum maritimum]